MRNRLAMACARIAAFAALVSVVGCVSVVGPPAINVTGITTMTCSETAFAPFTSVGRATLAGQAFLKTRGGDVKYGAGNQVILVPAVDCAVSWWGSAGRLWVGRFTFPSSFAFQKSMRQTTSNGEGRFEFKNIPTGKYYLRTEVTWEVPSMGIQGGLVGGVFDLADGEHKDLVLSSML